MPNEIRNVFISHIHEDDEGLPRLKNLGSTVWNDLPRWFNHQRKVQFGYE